MEGLIMSTHVDPNARQVTLIFGLKSHSTPTRRENGLRKSVASPEEGLRSPDRVHKNWMMSCSGSYLF